MPIALLINPFAADFKLYDEWMHPLGLYLLAGALKEHGFDVRFFNCLDRDESTKGKKYGTGDFCFQVIEKPAIYRKIPRHYKLYGRPVEELRAFLEESPHPDVICLGSMMTYWLPGVAETAAVVRSVYPEVPVIIGGIAARLMPEAVRRAVPGALLRDSAAAIAGLPEAAEPGCDRSLIGGFELMKVMRHGPICTSFGCPLQCSYCASQRLQGAFRRRPVSLILDEIRYCVDRFGVTDFAFYDDALLYEPDSGFIPLAQGLAGLQPGIRLHAPNGLHLRYVDARVAGFMKAAGFVTLRFGYESGASWYAGDRNRKTSREELAESLTILQDAGFGKKSIGVYVMAGLDGQTPEQVIEELEFVSSQGARAKPVYLSPVPGTPLFERYAERFPAIRTDPLWHNDAFFITQLPGWSFDAVESVRIKAAELNAAK